MMRIFIVLLFAISSWAMPVVEKYPSYSYVFGEFDVDSDYIYDDTFVKFLQKNEKRYQRFYKNSLKRGGHLIPTFKSMLIQDGLSDLFVYMSMIESGFSTDCVSCKSAVGIWQFMEATAKQYNLSVNSDFDERLDPILATSAAMNYMHKLYKDFGKWYLVAMAYNCGEGRLARAIKKAPSDDFSLLMDNDRKYIPPETRTYLKKIILLSMVGERIVKSETKESIEIKKEIIDGKILVNISGGTNLLKFIDMIHLGIGEFFEMNPQLSDYKISEDIAMVQVSIPADRFEQYQAFYTPPTLEQIFKIKH